MSRLFPCNKKGNEDYMKENCEMVQQIQESEMILIGLGEEFDDIKALKQIPEYSLCRQKVENSEEAWLIPAFNQLYEHGKRDVRQVLNKFAELIADKNYFVVSVSTNEIIREIPWREGRLVMPCGGSGFKQCMHGCVHGLMEVTDNDWTTIKSYKDKLAHGEEITGENGINLGVCPDCGGNLILNNIYTEKYDENGYLEQWGLYTKWLQGTLNRKLLILELGVGMQCPSVIRWPFEKVAYFNQKASFCRVNENLYQLSEELKEKGTSISQNAIDWLSILC